ncbi:hypothetical protein ACKS0A_01761 [Histoplasma ohiense]
MNTLVSHYTNCLDRQKGRKCLADLPVQSRRFNLFDKYVVGLPGNTDLFWGHFSKDPNGDARTWKRMAPDKFLWNTKLFPQLTDFVLEKLAERLNELEMHAFQKAAHIMVSLYCCAGSLERNTFNHIGIQRALKQPFDLTLIGKSLRSGRNFLGLFLEDFYECVANDFAFFLGIICNSLQLAEKPLAGVNHSKIDAKMFR